MKSTLWTKQPFVHNEPPPLRHLAAVGSDQPCTDHNVRFSGSMPCTGDMVCTVCGTMFHRDTGKEISRMNEIKNDRFQIEEWVLTHRSFRVTFSEPLESDNPCQVVHDAHQANRLGDTGVVDFYAHACYDTVVGRRVSPVDFADRPQLHGGNVVVDTIAPPDDDADVCMALSVPTYHGSYFGTIDGQSDLEDYGEPRVAIPIQTNGNWLRLFLHPQCTAEEEKQLCVERQTDRWSISLHQGDGDAIYIIHVRDDGVVCMTDDNNALVDKWPLANMHIDAVRTSLRGKTLPTAPYVVIEGAQIVWNNGEQDTIRAVYDTVKSELICAQRVAGNGPPTQWHYLKAAAHATIIESFQDGIDNHNEARQTFNSKVIYDAYQMPEWCK